jgi:beta-phosphoglucomutase
MGQVKALIFDMDGVLINSEPHHKLIERQLFDELNINVSEEEHHSYLGKSSELMWQEIILNHNLHWSVKELAGRTLQSIIDYFSLPGKVELIKGVEKLLEELKQAGIPMALASSAEPEVIDLFMRMSGLGKYFIHKVSFKAVGKSKPAPDIYIHAAEKLSLYPDECLAVEDSPNGIKAAKSANMICVAYSVDSSQYKYLAMADEIINDISLLTEILPKYLCMQFQQGVINLLSEKNNR